MLKCGQTEAAVGVAEKEFVGTSVARFINPMKKFLNEEMKSIQVKITSSFCVVILHFYLLQEVDCVLTRYPAVGSPCKQWFCVGVFYV